MTVQPKSNWQTNELVSWFRSADVDAAYAAFLEIEKMFRGKPGKRDAAHIEEMHENIRRIREIKTHCDDELVSVQVLPTYFPMIALRAARYMLDNELEHEELKEAAIYLVDLSQQAIEAHREKQSDAHRRLVELEDSITGRRIPRRPVEG